MTDQIMEEPLAAGARKKKVRTDRLLKLAAFLETVPAASFDLSNWQTKAPTKPEGKKQGDCGFAGCAVGWAAHAKLFRGLTLGEDSWGAFGPLYKGNEGFSAVSQLFGLDRDSYCGDGQAEFLFLGSRYPHPCDPTPKQVAERIRQFVAANTSSPVRGGSPI